MTIREKYYIIEVYEKKEMRQNGSDDLNILGRRRDISVSASVLSADLVNLSQELAKLEKSGIDMLHFDVMDGTFVDNITYGLPVLEQVNRATDMPLDVHLMIEHPLRYAKRFAAAGADVISFHLEAADDAAEVIRAIRSAGASPSAAIKPDTPAEAVMPYLHDIDMVLVMTVEPGFGGQSFIQHTTEKIRRLREESERLGLDLAIEVDGGINAATAPTVRSLGADVLVSGSYLFGADDMKSAAETLRGNAGSR